MKLSAYSDATGRWGLVEGEALGVLARLPDASIDAVVTDPPYGIGFAGHAWDQAQGPGAFERWSTEWARACRRVLKPGAHLLAFGAPRTAHRLTAGIEDSGLEIRDQLLWLHAQGMPKGRRLTGGRSTALRPAYEPIVLARKPLTGTTEQNLARFSTGTLNIEEAGLPGGGWPTNLTATEAPGVPSRLYFCAKPTKREREAGCEALPLRDQPLYWNPTPRLRRNTHPTVKPLSLMRWLIRLAVPAGGLVLDPFVGSGTTAIASVLEDRRFIGVEREGSYVDIACARLAHWTRERA